METDLPLSERAFEYPFKESIADIKHYRDYVGGLDLPQSYFLHKDDILFLINELMNLEAKAYGIRCYPAREEVTGRNHMLVVAVVEDDPTGFYPNGKDIYTAGDPSRIFDLTRPCPNMCDTESALYSASLQKEQLRLRDLKPAHKTE